MSIQRLIQLIKELNKFSLRELHSKYSFDQNTLKAIIVSLVNSQADRMRIIEAMTYGAPLSGIKFLHILCKLPSFLGFNDSVFELCGLLWADMFRLVDEKEQDGTLQSLYKEWKQENWNLISYLPSFFRNFKIRDSFLPSFLIELNKHLVANLANHSFYDAVSVYGNKYPIEGANVLEEYFKNGIDSDNLFLTATLLGSIRACPAERRCINATYQKVENKLSKSRILLDIICYEKSWNYYLKLKKVPVSSFFSILNKINLDTKEEFIEASNLIFTYLHSSPSSLASYKKMLCWMKENTKSSISENAKFFIVLSLLKMNGSKYYRNKRLNEDVDKVLFNIQPIDSIHENIWININTLIEIKLKLGAPYFKKFFTDLCECNPNGIKGLIDKSYQIWRLLSDKYLKSLIFIVSTLLINKEIAVKGLALRIFEQCRLSKFDSKLFKEIDDARLKAILVYISRCYLGADIYDKIFIALAKYCQNRNQEIQSIFCTELKILCINYPEPVLSNLKKQSRKQKIIKETIKLSEEYFLKTNELKDYPFKKIAYPKYMDIYRRGKEYQNNRIREEAKQQSIFRLVTKELNIIYGRQCMSYINKKLGDPIPLQTMGVSVPIPILELIDPEGLALRAMQNLDYIRNCGDDGQSE